MVARVTQILLSLAVIASLPSDNATISHVLERTSFGPRPGDVERIHSIGVERYIDEQLHPERLPDAGTEARLAELATLRMSTRQIANEFEAPLEEARRAGAL